MFNIISGQLSSILLAIYRSMVSVSIANRCTGAMREVTSSRLVHSCLVYVRQNLQITSDSICTQSLFTENTCLYMHCKHYGFIKVHQPQSKVDLNTESRPVWNLNPESQTPLFQGPISNVVCPVGNILHSFSCDCNTDDRDLITSWQCITTGDFWSVLPHSQIT